MLLRATVARITNLAVVVTLGAIFIAGSVIGTHADAAPSKYAKVSFTFDDGLESSLSQAAPIMQKYGVPGTNYVTTGCVGTTGTCYADNSATYMTWPQVKTLQNTYGWEIGSHTVSHFPMTTLSDTQKEQELADSKQILAANGIDATSFATPEGDYDPSTLALAAKYYTSHRGFWDLGVNDWPYDESVIRVMQVQTGVSVASVKTAIDSAISQSQWLVLVFHDIKINASDKVTDYQYSTADLEQIAAYAGTKQSAGQLKATTVSGAIAVTDSNLLPNGDFANGITSGWTTNTPANVQTDSAGNGAYPNANNAIRFTAGTSNAHLFSPKVSVSNSNTYLLKSFINIKQRTAGELGFYIDEYDANGNWISGKWEGAENAVFVENYNFDYTPTSAAVKQASLQIYATGNSGITAFVDNVRWYGPGTPAPDPTPTPTPTPDPTPTATNLVANGMFDGGISAGWSTDTPAQVTADGTGNGSPANALNAIKFVSTTKNVHLFSPKVLTGTGKSYTITTYLDIKQINSGEIGFYIDEYNTAGNWVSGQWKGARYAAAAGDVKIVYAPSSTNVAMANLQIYATANSGLTAFADDVRWYDASLPEPTPTPTPDPTPSPTPDPTHSPTNMIANGTFDAGISAGWATTNTNQVIADSSSNGSSANPVNSIKMVAASSNVHLFSPKVAVTNSNTYSLTTYLNITQITAGEAGFYIDEYDIAGNWVSGQWKTARYAATTGDVTLSYAPSSAIVATASLQIYVTANSGITAYVDNIRWYPN